MIQKFAPSLDQDLSRFTATIGTGIILETKYFEKNKKKIFLKNVFEKTEQKYWQVKLFVRKSRHVLYLSCVYPDP